MKKLAILLTVLALLGLGFAGPAVAAPKKVKAKPFVLDLTADNSGQVKAAWITHAGLPDAGKSNHALHLEKLSAAPAEEALAGAKIFGVKGVQFNYADFTLEYDYFTEGFCGDTSPRIEVTVVDDVTLALTTYVFGCTAGTQTTNTQDPLWTHVVLTGAEADTPMPATGSATIESIQIIFDAGTDVTVDINFARLDNIQILGFPPIGKPGNARWYKTPK